MSPGSRSRSRSGSLWLGSLWLGSLWVWVWVVVLGAAVTRAVRLEELFRFGAAAGDEQLHPGADSTAELHVRAASVFLFHSRVSSVYINTNGFVAADKPPPESEYLGKMPADFKMMAALLGDLDNSDGQGTVFFRQDTSPDVLNRASEHISQAFPTDERAEPQSVLVITWVNMAAQGTSGRGDGLDVKRNTFQLVVALMKSSSCAILFYPTDGLQFLSTSIGSESKLLEAGFNEGVVQGWFQNSQGTYYRTTTDEEASIKELTEKTNSGRKGVWVYEIGPARLFANIIPGIVSTLPVEEETTVLPVTVLPQQTDDQHEVHTSTYSTQTLMTTEEPPEETETPHVYQSGSIEAETFTPTYERPGTEETNYEPGQFETEYSTSETVTPTYSTPDRVNPGYTNQPEQTSPDQTETSKPITEPLQHESTSPQPSEPTDSSVQQGYPNPDPVQPLYTSPEHTEPKSSPVQPAYPDPDPVQPRYINPEPVQPVPPHSRAHQPQIVVVDEDENLDVEVFAYNLETCAHNRHKCSLFADCRDYSNGYCCHCRPGYYGNGKDCVAEGKPQRMNGKVNGRVFVGSSPVELTNKDLHSYVVANDGRAYIAISNIPKSVGPSLQPLSSLGGVIGWAFALEQPGYENGFSLIGGAFSRQAEVIFHPGNERLIIRQQFRGIDEHDHLVVSTELEGHLPTIPLGSLVQINPYKEIYHYDRNLITSSSNRDYTVSSPDGTAQTRSYQWRQTITFQSCPHDEASGAAPSTQQLSVDQIFVMFDAENDLIRYAMSNKIGSVHSGPPEQNPCFTGRHGCDINAVCRPADGLQFSCQCAAGFTGDGRYCHDIDECRETPWVCGANAVCSNQAGTFRCECSSGFMFASDGATCIEENRPVDHCQRGSHDCDVLERALCRYAGGSAYTCACLPGFEGDGRLCQDVDECQQDPCHRDAGCSNTQGSYTCHCPPGFHGDGLLCTPTSSERDKSPCERQRDSALAPASSGFLSFFRPRPAVGQYVPQCDEHGAFTPTQCHGSVGQCWCVDADGQEIPDTRSGPSSAALCINQAVTPVPVGPTPRPDVQPVAPGTHLLFAQSGKIESVPLEGYVMKTEEAKPLLHIPDRVVIALAYDCVEKMVYWTDITGPSISRASVSGGDVQPVVTEELQSPEGIAVDHVSRLLFWTDSMRDTVEVSRLDGSHRRVLFDTDLVNPRAVVTNPAYGQLYWADWDRDGPKIEMSNMDGTQRTVLVNEDLGLPNGLTFDPDNQQLCWADAGTRKVECLDPHRRLRKQIIEGIQYPFALVSYGRSLFYTDWRREAVVAVDRHLEKETEEFLPRKRSRLYGITATPTRCLQAYNYCSNNGGCSHLCLPRLGGFTCRCPDAADGPCEETNQ